MSGPLQHYCGDDRRNGDVACSARRPRAADQAFTLIELMVVIAIIAVLAGMLLLTAVGVWGQLRAGESSRNPDLSSPEATVRSFAKAAARGETKIVQACFLPGGEDYDDLHEVMEASPGTPSYRMKAMLAALDTEAKMPILEQTETEHGTKVVWRVTFKREFDPGKGPVFKVGSTCDLDATLKKSGSH